MHTPRIAATITVAGRVFSTWGPLTQRIFASVHIDRDQVIDYRFPGQVLVDYRSCGHTYHDKVRIENLSAEDTARVAAFFLQIQRK